MQLAAVVGIIKERDRKSREGRRLNGGELRAELCEVAETDLRRVNRAPRSETVNTHRVIWKISESEGPTATQPQLSRPDRGSAAEQLIFQFFWRQWSDRGMAVHESQMQVRATHIRR